MKTTRSSLAYFFLRFFVVAIPLSLIALNLRGSDGSPSRQTGFLSGPRAENGLETGKWIAARVAAAKAGKLEIVRVPLVIRSMGWGSNVPEHFIGISVGNHHGGETWVKVKVRRGVKVKTGREGGVFMVEGRFTGRILELDMRGKDGEPREWLYNLSELEVSKARPLNKKEKNSLEEIRVQAKRIKRVKKP